ncbi:MAG: divalent-cation tolerance protein CutA [Gammaproteobacteria bacterium]|nr:divalent-cation tolerance protein CutA [Gammaproteobacteria bacterium]
MPSDHLLVLTTCPDAGTARVIARTLVEERLAACVNRLDGVVSTYRWEGGTREDAECLLLIKTATSAFERLAARVQALHPYELPELIAISVEGGSDRYLRWLSESTA